MNELEKKIEAVLFFKNEPIRIKKLAEILSVSIEEVHSSLSSLKDAKQNQGVVLFEKDDEVMLGTNPDYSVLIENLQKEELNKELSRASLETLSIVLYKNGATRAEIDYIRGVNSSFTLRALSVRGLVEKEIDPEDSRRFLYKPTFDLLAYMGIQSTKDLLNREEVLEKISEVERNKEEDK